MPNAMRLTPRAGCRPYLLCLGLAAMPASAEDDAARFAAVLAANPPREDVACSYTSVSASSEYAEGTRTESYSVRDGWRLVAVNGLPPTAEALAEYDAEASEREEGGQIAFDLAAVAAAAPGSVRIGAEDAETVAFSFAPTFENAEEMAEHMRGTLIVGKGDLRPQRLILTLRGTFSPAASVKVSEFRQEMTFVVDAATNATLLAEMVMSMRGKAFVFKKIEEDLRMTFSDFDCRSTSADSVAEEAPATPAAANAALEGAAVDADDGAGGEAAGLAR